MFFIFSFVLMLGQFFNRVPQTEFHWSVKQHSWAGFLSFQGCSFFILSDTLFPVFVERVNFLLPPGVGWDGGERISNEITSLDHMTMSYWCLSLSVSLSNHQYCAPRISQRRICSVCLTHLPKSVLRDQANVTAQTPASLRWTQSGTSTLTCKSS